MKYKTPLIFRLSLSLFFMCAFVLLVVDAYSAEFYILILSMLLNLVVLIVSVIVTRKIRKEDEE